MEEPLILVSTVVFSKFLLIPGPVAARESLVCLAIISMVVVVEVLPVVAAATPLDGGASNLSFNRRLLQVSANPGPVAARESLGAEVVGLVFEVK
ncbi:hypothetical protein V6N11_079203 [Hibiscus sabdariffa]|uniref:Uncharacterized protein n=1 Tax=Hibiscus sabdariffa TaxID=183260 RepID=A0ABR2RUX1_9ROSI